MTTVPPLPGFTAEAALHSGRGRGYRAGPAPSPVAGAGTLMAATAKGGKLEWIDCNGFPDNITCQQCGNSGPGSVNCCPDDYCVVIDRAPVVGGVLVRSGGAFGRRFVG